MTTMTAHDTMPNLQRNSLQVKALEENLHSQRNSVICAFNQLLDLKDMNTGVHSTRLAEWGMRVGQELGLDEAALQISRSLRCFTTSEKLGFRIRFSGSPRSWIAKNTN